MKVCKLISFVSMKTFQLSGHSKVLLCLLFEKICTFAKLAIIFQHKTKNQLKRQDSHFGLVMQICASSYHRPFWQGADQEREDDDDDDSNRKPQHCTDIGRKLKDLAKTYWNEIHISLFLFHLKQWNVMT